MKAWDIQYCHSSIWSWTRLKSPTIHLGPEAWSMMREEISRNKAFVTCRLRGKTVCNSHQQPCGLNECMDSLDPSRPPYCLIPVVVGRPGREGRNCSHTCVGTSNITAGAQWSRRARHKTKRGSRMVESLVEFPDIPGSQMSFTCPIHARWQLGNHPVLAAQSRSIERPKNTPCWARVFGFTKPRGEENGQNVKMARAKTPAATPEQKPGVPSYADGQHEAGEMTKLIQHSGGAKMAKRTRRNESKYDQ